MQKAILLCGVMTLLQTITLFATTFTSITDGPWNDPSTWDQNAVPNVSGWPGDHVNIAHEVTLSSDISFTQGAGFNIQSGGHLLSTENLTINYTTGAYIIASGATLTVANLYQTYSGMNITAAGTINATTFEVQGTVNVSGKIVVSDLDVTPNGTFNINGGILTVYNDIDITNGGDFHATNTTMDVNGNFRRSGGGTMYVTGGNLDIDGEMDLGTAGAIPFNGVTVNIGETFTMAGDGKVQIDGETSFSVSSSIHLYGSGAIEGHGSGGMLSFSAVDIAGGGSYVQCVGGHRNYTTGESFNSPFDLDVCASAQLLPVELLSFNGETKERGIELKWITASEKDNDYFQVEQSINGIDWKVLGEVSGQGTTNEESHYQFFDNDNYSSAYSFYRLKQVDFDGTSTYSEMISVIIKNNGTSDIEVNVYPNPIADFVTIEMDTESDEDISVILIDMVGRRFVLNNDDKSNATNLSIPSNMPDGSYVIMVLADNELYASKRVFVKRNN